MGVLRLMEVRDSMEFELWVEKYRPRRLSEMCDQREVVRYLEAFVRMGSIPHLLFAGPAGTGKTTAAICIAYELLGDSYGANYLELNASDERGIDVIRGKIKDFARSKPIAGAPFKIIHLDESDNLTSEAQHALRRTMELYSDNCRFIFACNYISKIIPPIQSRCAVFRFSPIPLEDFKIYLGYIAGSEGVSVDDEALEALYSVSRGDLRTGINILQAAAFLDKNVDSDAIYKVSGMAKPGEIGEMVKLAFDGKLTQARERLHRLLIVEGVSPSDILYQVYGEVVNSTLDDMLKARILEVLGEVDFRIREGANSEIQLSYFLSQLALIGGGVK